MKTIKYCRDCKFNQPEAGIEWKLRCVNDFVCGKDASLLSAIKNIGLSCRLERGKSWIDFPACGKSGKLFEAK